MSRTASPPDRSTVAVPPVETNSHFNRTRPVAKSTRPVLLETDNSAIGMRFSSAPKQMKESVNDAGRQVNSGALVRHRQRGHDPSECVDVPQVHDFGRRVTVS